MIDHTPDPHERDLNIPVIATVGVIGVVLLAVIILGVEAWFRYEWNREADQKVVQAVNFDLQRLKTEQAANLQGYRRVDPQGQQVQIPIDRAMELVIRERAQGR